MSRPSSGAAAAREAPSRGGGDNDDFPTILPSQDLMALVQSVPPPGVLELRSIVQFPHFKPGSHSFEDFLNTFASNTTTHTVRLSRHFTTGFSDEEFCQILRAFARLRLRHISFVDGGDSRLRRLRIAEVAGLIRSAPRLETVKFGRYWLLAGNDGERLALARALAHHPALRVFHYDGCGVKPQQPQQQLQQQPAQQQQQQPPAAAAAVPLQLYQAIAPRADPDAVLNALATCPALESVRITHSPYCARDYSVAAVARLLCCGGGCARLRECSIVTRVANWAPLLAQINDYHHHHHHNNNNNNHALAATASATDAEANNNNHGASTTSTTAAATATAGSRFLERLVLTTAEHGLTSVDTLGPLAVHLHGLPHLRQLSLRFWGGPFQPLRDTSAALAEALAANGSLRIFALSEGRRAGSTSTATQSQSSSTPRRRTTNAAARRNGTTTNDDDDDDKDPEYNLETNVPPKVILPAGTHPSLSNFDFARFETALRHNPRLQLRLDVGIAAADEDAYDRVRIQSNLNAMGRFSATTTSSSSTTATTTASTDRQRPDQSSSWFEAFSTLERLCRNETEEFLQSCLFRFLRSNPQYWCR